MAERHRAGSGLVERKRLDEPHKGWLGHLAASSCGRGVASFSKAIHKLQAVMPRCVSVDRHLVRRKLQSGR